MPANDNYIKTRRELMAARVDLFEAKQALKLYQTLAFLGWTGFVLYLLGV